MDYFREAYFKTYTTDIIVDATQSASKLMQAAAFCLTSMW